MSLLETSALAVVVLAGVYLLTLGAVSLFVPARASRFLLGFASSAPLHFTELFLRFAVGAALVIHAPFMALPGVFHFFGWVLLVTTTCLLIMPWRWHHRFAQQVAPLFTRYVALIGVVALAMGGLILWAVAGGSASYGIRPSQARFAVPVRPEPQRAGRLNAGVRPVSGSR